MCEEALLMWGFHSRDLPHQLLSIFSANMFLMPFLTGGYLMFFRQLLICLKKHQHRQSLVISHPEVSLVELYHQAHVTLILDV
jgi:hypothetical protein